MIYLTFNATSLGYSMVCAIYDGDGRFHGDDGDLYDSAAFVSGDLANRLHRAHHHYDGGVHLWSHSALFHSYYCGC